MKQVIFLTVNHCGPLPLRELHSTDDTIVWRDPGGSWACLRPVSDYEWIHPFRVCRWHRHTCMWRPCEAGRFSYGESPRTPPLEGTSLHRRHNRYSVERPWGILSLLLRPVSDYEWIQPSRGWRWHKHNYMYLPSLWSGSFFLQWIEKEKRRKKIIFKEKFLFPPLRIR